MKFSNANYSEWKKCDRKNIDMTIAWRERKLFNKNLSELPIFTKEIYSFNAVNTINL